MQSCDLAKLRIDERHQLGNCIQLAVIHFRKEIGDRGGGVHERPSFKLYGEGLGRRRISRPWIWTTTHIPASLEGIESSCSFSARAPSEYLLVTTRPPRSAKSRRSRISCTSCRP